MDLYAWDVTDPSFLSSEHLFVVVLENLANLLE
jgi:hypothetical protein